MLPRPPLFALYSYDKALRLTVNKHHRLPNSEQLPGSRTPYLDDEDQPDCCRSCCYDFTCGVTFQYLAVLASIFASFLITYSMI